MLYLIRTYVSSASLTKTSFLYIESAGLIDRKGKEALSLGYETHPTLSR